jgi:hypothetical protein
VLLSMADCLTGLIIEIQKHVLYLQVTQIVDIISAEFHDALDRASRCAGCVRFAGDMTDGVCSGLDACCDILIHHAVRRTGLYQANKVSMSFCVAVHMLLSASERLTEKQRMIQAHNALDDPRAFS